MRIGSLMATNRYSLRERESGRIQARWYAPDGRRRSKTFANRTEAKRYLDMLSGDKHRHLYIDPADAARRFETVAERWLAGKHLAPKTAADYRSILTHRIYPAFQFAPVGTVTPQDLVEWLADLSDGLAPGTVHNAFRVMKQILTTAVRARYLPANPADVLNRGDLPKLTDREMLFLTAEEVAQLAGELTAPYDLMALFTTVTGLRAGEVTGLRWENVDLLRGRVIVCESISRVDGVNHVKLPKNNKERTVPLTKDVATRLRAYAAASEFRPEGYVWPDPNDPEQPMNWGRDFYWPHWKPAVARAGLPSGLRFHDLRHTCAALLIAADVQPKAIQVHLGHSSFHITMDRYGHLYGDASDKVVAAMDAAFGTA